MNLQIKSRIATIKADFILEMTKTVLKDYHQEQLLADFNFLEDLGTAIKNAVYEME